MLRDCKCNKPLHPEPGRGSTIATCYLFRLPVEQVIIDTLETRPRDATPFAWTKTADETFAQVAIFCRRTPGPGY
jgi:hypothetical protein